MFSKSPLASLLKHLQIVYESRNEGKDAAEASTKKIDHRLDQLEQLFEMKGKLSKQLQTEMDGTMDELSSEGPQLILIFNSLKYLTLSNVHSLLIVFTGVFQKRKEALTAQVIAKSTTVFGNLIELYCNGSDTTVATTAGQFCRLFIRAEAVAVHLLNNPTLRDPFITKIPPHAQFEISADGFVTLKALLLKHNKEVGKWFRSNAEVMLTLYSPLLASKSPYVVKRQALKLLVEILVTREHYYFMIHFINDPKQLTTILMCFGSKNKAIKFEAFHSFKLFVANPQKTPEVAAVLLKHKKRLLDFLNTFDWQNFQAQFADEITMIKTHLDKLETEQKTAS